MAPASVLRTAVSSPPVVQDSELLPPSGCVVEEEFHSASPMFQPTIRVDQAVSPAILAPFPAVSEMETKPNVQTEHQPDPPQGQLDRPLDQDPPVTSSLHSSMTIFFSRIINPMELSRLKDIFGYLQWC